VLVPLLHATSMHKRRDKPSDGSAEEGENAKRKKQEGEKDEASRIEIFRQSHVVRDHEDRGEDEEIGG
jgi:hypothetical protein